MQLLKIYYVISEKKSKFKEDSETETSWERDDQFCKSNLLNCLLDHLADVCSNKPSVKDIWNTLEEPESEESECAEKRVQDN